MLEEEVRRARQEEEGRGGRDGGGVPAGADLSGVEFRRVCLHRCRFQNCDFSGRSLTGWSGAGCDFSTAAASATVWTDTVVRLQGGRRPVHRQPVAGLYPGRERLPLRQFYTVAVEKVPHGNCQLRRAVLAGADVAGLSPHRTGFQEVDFFARR